MPHYLDIRLRPDPEFPANHLMSALLSKLHRALVQIDNHAIGVSFPGWHAARHTLGTTLRLHGPQTALQAMTENAWLAGMRDHVTITTVAAAPATASHWRVKRIQVKSNPERLRRRQMRRHGITEEEARQQIPDSAAKTSSLPFAVLQSTSTSQRFLLFIHQEEVPTAQEGAFNAYGLSNQATVPKF